MTNLPFMRYALESVMRNRVQSLYSAIGVTIAVMLVAGSLIAIDSSVYGMLRPKLESIPTDFVGEREGPLPSVTDEYLQEPVSLFESISGIRSVQPWVAIPSVVIANESDENPERVAGRVTSVVLVPAGGQTILDSFGITGTVPQTGTAAVSAKTAFDLGLNLDDNVVCAFPNLNLTLTVSQLLTQSMPEEYYETVHPSLMKDDEELIIGVTAPSGQGQVVLRNPLIVNLDWGAEIWDQVKSSDPSVASQARAFYLVWCDRPSVIHVSSIDNTIQQLDRIERRLSTAGLTYGVEFGDSDLVEPLTDIDEAMNRNKPVFLGMSLPVVALGLYLSYIGVGLGMRRRRREIGILKSRGADDKQIMTYMLTESLLLGVLSGVAGLFGGVGISRMLIGLALNYSRETTMAFVGDMIVQPMTVAIAVLTGVVLMIVSSYDPVKEASSMNVRDALHWFSAKTEQFEYRARKDLLMLVLSFWIIVTVLLLPEPPNYSPSYVIQVGLWFPVWAGHAMVPLLPFMLSFSLVRLLTLGSKRRYVKVSRLLIRWTKELDDLIRTNLTRSPRRASSVCIMIALPLAFGLFVSITAESSIAYQRDVVGFTVGSDIRVFGIADDSREMNSSYLTQISGIEGVSEHAVCFFPDRIQETVSYYTVSLAAVNSSSYVDTVEPTRSLFASGAADLIRLRDNGTAFVSQSFAGELDLEVGDEIPMVFSFLDTNSSPTQVSLSMRIIGIMKGLPGLSDVDMIVDSASMRIVPSELLFSRSSVVALLSVDENADAEEVVDEIKSILEEAGLMIVNYEILDAEIADIQSDPSFGALEDFLMIEYGHALIIMGLGVSLVLFVSVTDREHELACILARGASKLQLRKLVLGESLTLAILGMGLGAVTGVLTAWSYGFLLSQGSISGVAWNLELSAPTVVLLLISILSILAASLSAAARANRIRLAEILRTRGG